MYEELIEQNKHEIEAIMAFRKADRVMRGREYELLREFGITTMQFGVLELLFFRGDMSVLQLIHEMYTTPGNMTVIVRNTEREGYINRKKNLKDRRSYIISITDKGRKLVKVLLPRYMEYLGGLVSNFSDDEKKTAVRLLKKVSDIGEADERMSSGKGFRL